MLGPGSPGNLLTKKKKKKEKKEKDCCDEQERKQYVSFFFRCDEDYEEESRKNYFIFSLSLGTKKIVFKEYNSCLQKTKKKFRILSKCVSS